MAPKGSKEKKKKAPESCCVEMAKFWREVVLRLVWRIMMK